jgi:hypothetical protein
MGIVWFAGRWFHRPLDIQRPVAIRHLKESRPEINQYGISPTLYERVERLRRFLDSLQLSDRVAYKKILAVRPHLRDSILLFERSYKIKSDTIWKR